MLDLSSFGLPLRRLSHLLFFFCMMFFMAPVAFAKNIDLLDSSSSEPLPQRLTPLWWNQISELNNQELVKKSELFKHELSRIQLAGESFELRSQVVVLLNKYINERNAPLRLAVTEEPLKKRYNLSDIGLMIKNNEVLDSDIKLLQVIHNEELEKIKNYNEQLSVIKLLYFKKDTRGLTKLVSGLRWIKTQLKVAILKINEERIKTEIKGKLNVFNSFQNRKEFALSHFVIEPQQLIDAEKSKVSYQTK